MIIFMVVFLYGGIPALIPLGFVNIFSRYISNRSLLQNNSSKIEGLEENFNSMTLTFLPIVLILSPLVAEWMITGN